MQSKVEPVVIVICNFPINAPLHLALDFFKPDISPLLYSLLKPHPVPLSNQDIIDLYLQKFQKVQKFECSMVYKSKGPKMFTGSKIDYEQIKAKKN